MTDAYRAPGYRYGIEYTNNTQDNEWHTDYMNFNIQGILMVGFIITNNLVQAHEFSPYLRLTNEAGVDFSIAGVRVSTMHTKIIINY